jgi:hypothetical protein
MYLATSPSLMKPILEHSSASGVLCRPFRAIGVVFPQMVLFPHPYRPWIPGASTNRSTTPQHGRQPVFRCMQAIQPVVTMTALRSARRARTVRGSLMNRITPFCLARACAANGPARRLPTKVCKRRQRFRSVRRGAGERPQSWPGQAGRWGSIRCKLRSSPGNRSGPP